MIKNNKKLISHKKDNLITFILKHLFFLVSVSLQTNEKRGTRFNNERGNASANGRILHHSR